MSKANSIEATEIFSILSDTINGAKFDDLCDATHMIVHIAGYHKQSEGEWETIPDYQPNKLIAYRHICSVCKTTYKDIRPHGHKYCHECGAKMKGGAE